MFKETCIADLLHEWFPVLMQWNGGYFFGGMLREMRFAALTSRDIRLHMFDYFQNQGGDVDFYISYRDFIQATRCPIWGYEHSDDSPFITFKRKNAGYSSVRATILAKIHPELESIEIPVDIIMDHFDLDCDFLCNALKLCVGEDTIQLRILAKKTTMEQVDNQLMRKTLSVITCGDDSDDAKIIFYRLCKLLDKGWRVDETSLFMLAKLLIHSLEGGFECIHNMHQKFIIDNPQKVFNVFLLCKEEICALYRTFKNGYCSSALKRIALLHAYVDQVPLFLQWCYNSRRFWHAMLEKTAEEHPQSIPLYCNFRTNGNAVNFLVTLIKFDLKALFLKYVQMQSFKATIAMFNRLSDKDKAQCKLFYGIFIIDGKSIIGKYYVDILLQHGMELPKQLNLLEITMNLSEQPLWLIDLLYQRKIIRNGDLFPTHYASTCMAPTGDNLEWLLQKACKIKLHQVDVMASKLNVLDLKFLSLYGAFCRKNGREVAPHLPEIFELSLMSDQWTHVEQYFMYRFDTPHPTFDQVSKMLVVKKYDMPTLFGRYPNHFKRIIRIYGPLVCYGFLNKLYCIPSRETQKWLILVYWLWRIGQDSIPVAWKLSKDIVDIVASHLSLFDLNSYSGPWRRFYTKMFFVFKNNKRV